MAKAPPRAPKGKGPGAPARKATSAPARRAPAPARKAAARGPLAVRLRKAFGDKAFGPTLEALLALAPRSAHIAVDDDAVTEDARRRLLDGFGIVVVGRAANGYFGPLVTKLGKTVDASPMGYADRKGVTPELAGKDLASFLGLWAYAPGFFTLGAQSADDWEQLHAELFADLDADAAAVVAEVAALPGVAVPRSGAEVVHLLEQAGPRTADGSGKVPEAARRAGLAPLAGGKAAIEESVQASFAEHVGKAKLLVDVETVTSDDDSITVVIGVNAERADAPRVVKHPVVDRPLRAMLNELRDAFLDKDVSLKFQCVSPGGAEGRRSLALALTYAGALDLLAELKLD